MFQMSILKVESDFITATEASQVYKELVVKLEERKSANFIPFAAKLIHRRLTDEESVDNNFLNSVEGFYQAAIKYLKLWENSFDKANHFKWLTLKTYPTWDEMEDSALTVASVIPDSINVDALFDERSSLIPIVNSLKPEWDSLPKEDTPKTCEKWKQIFQAFERSNVSFTNIFKVVEFAMCLPGTSAPAERIFSMMGSVWTAERGRLSLSVVRDLLYIKANSVMSCIEFHDQIKNDKPFLKKVRSSNKYEARREECIPGPSSINEL